MESSFNEPSEEDIADFIARSEREKAAKPKPKPKPKPKDKIDSRSAATAFNPFYDAASTKKFIDQYKRDLAKGADYWKVNDGDKLAGYYSTALSKAFSDSGMIDSMDLIGGESPSSYTDSNISNLISSDQYMDATGAPEYLTDIYNGKPRDENEAQSAYAVLNVADSPEEIATILGGYYGYDFTPTAQKLGRFGGSDKSKPTKSEEFHSFIEPILTEQVAYLQTTQGISYEDALVKTFNTDPMLQALYGKYEVSPMRQTKDGSTYLYDPFSYGEIRTNEVKDNDLGSALKIIATVAAAIYAPQMLLKAGVFGAPTTAVAATATTAATTGYSVAQTAAAAATVAGATTAVQGGDFKDVLLNMGVAGAGAAASEILANLATEASTTAKTAEGAKAGSKAAIAATTAANNYKVGQAAYAATQIGIGALTGNVGAGFLAAFGPALTSTALDKVGLTSEFLSRAGVDQELLVGGLVKTQQGLARGLDFETAMATGLGQYVVSGGGIAGYNKDSFLKAMGSVLRSTRDGLGNMFGGTEIPDDAVASLSNNELFNLYNFESSGNGAFVDYRNNAVNSGLEKTFLEDGSAIWTVQSDGSIYDSVSQTTIDPAINPEGVALLLKLEMDGVTDNFDLGSEQIETALNNLEPFLGKPSLTELKASTVVPEPPLGWTLMGGDYNSYIAAINNGTVKQELEDFGLADFDSNIGLGVDYKSGTSAEVSGLSKDDRAYLVGNTIDQIAEAMHREDVESGGDSAGANDFRAEAINAYQELRDDGYSHLRVMEELGMDTSGRVLDAVRALDTVALDELRAGDDREAYLRALGTVDETTGRYHEDTLYKTGVEDAFGLYDLAKRAVTAAEETGDDDWIIGTAIAIEAGADVANSFLGLAALGGIDPGSTELGKTLEAITDMTGSSKPEDYKKGLKDIEKRLQGARNKAKRLGLGTKDSWLLVGEAIIGAASENPIEFGLDYIVKEAASELIAIGTGGVAFAGAKITANVARKFGDEIANNFAKNLDPSMVAVNVTTLSDSAEATGDAARSGYEESYNAKITQFEKRNARIAEATGVGSIPLSETQIKEAEEFATSVARKAGITGFITSIIGDKVLGGEELAQGLFGDKVTSMSTKFIDSFIERVSKIGVGTATEGGAEFLEEGAVQAVIEMALYEVDPTRPVDANIATSAILAGIVGSSVGGGLGTGIQVADVLSNVVKNTSPTIRAAIEGAKNGAMTDAELRQTLSQFGIDSDSFAGLETSLLNDAFNDQYTTYSEALDAFQEANPGYEPTEADLNKYTGNNPDAELNTQVDAYVDSRYIDSQEVMDAAAEAGISITQEEAEQYVRQTSVNADLVIDKIMESYGSDDAGTPEEAVEAAETEVKTETKVEVESEVEADPYTK